MKTLFVILTLLGSQIVLAHADHAPPREAACITKSCTSEQIEKAVPAALTILEVNGAIEKSWLKVKVDKVSLKDFKKGKEWVAELFDASQKDKAKQRLYIFITQEGFLNGMNFDGK